MVGAGIGRGQSWLSTLTKLTERSDLYELCAFSEALPDRTAQNEKRWHVPGYTDIRAMLERARPDVVLNGAPSDSNSMVLGLCAPRGVHVLTEIPIAPTLRIADWMMETADRYGVKLEVTEQVYLWPREQLKRLIRDAGLIGEIVHARLWYANKADYHGLNGVRMLIGREARRVLGFGGRVPVPPFQGYEGDLVTQDFWDAAAIEFEGGLTCLFEDPPRGRMSARWDVEGTKGQLVGSDLYIGTREAESQHFPFVAEYQEVDGRRAFESVRVDTDPAIVFRNPHRSLGADEEDEVARMELLVGFHRAVTGGGEPAYGPSNARKDLELCYAIRESARRGNVWLDLPLLAPTALEERLEQAFVAVYGYDPEDAEDLAGVRIPRAGVRWRVAGLD